MPTETERNPLAVRADRDNARRAARRKPMLLATIGIWGLAIWAFRGDVLSENHATFILVAAIFWSAAYLTDRFVEDSQWDT